MSEEIWYVRKSGKVTGPFTRTQLDGLLASRPEISHFHEVSQDKQSWSPASTLSWIFPDAAAGQDGSKSDGYAESRPPPPGPAAGPGGGGITTPRAPPGR